jgi:hypothetical protein
MAERVGFEPTVEFPLHSLSRRALSTAQTPLRANSGPSSLTNAPGAHNYALRLRDATIYELLRAGFFVPPPILSSVSCARAL